MPTISEGYSGRAQEKKEINLIRNCVYGVEFLFTWKHAFGRRQQSNNLIKMRSKNTWNVYAEYRLRVTKWPYFGVRVRFIEGSAEYRFDLR